MTKFKSFHVETKIGNGDLDIFVKSRGEYFANYNGLSGLAHEIKLGSETLAANVDFKFEDSSYDNLIVKCRAEIEKRDSAILCFDPIS
jgi:hypothetical protein